MKKPPPPAVLLSGFEPFGGEACNPSWDAVRALDGKRIAAHRVVTCCLPVDFEASLAALHAAIDAHSPALVLCVGQAGGRAQISLERIAINVIDARIADNIGAQPVDEAVIADGPAAYFSDLPIKTMLAQLRAAGIPAEISQTAGTYVCNQVFYGLMHALRDVAGVRGGFIHIPFSPQQAAYHPGAPSLSVATVSQALHIALQAALTSTVDLRTAAGAEH